MFLTVFEGSRGVSVEFVGDARVNGGDRVDGGVGERREAVHFEIDHGCYEIAFSQAVMRLTRFLRSVDGGNVRELVPDPWS